MLRSDESIFSKDARLQLLGSCKDRGACHHGPFGWRFGRSRRQTARIGRLIPMFPEGWHVVWLLAADRTHMLKQYVKHRASKLANLQSQSDVYNYLVSQEERYFRWPTDATASVWKSATPIPHPSTWLFHYVSRCFPSKIVNLALVFKMIVCSVVFSTLSPSFSYPRIFHCHDSRYSLTFTLGPPPLAHLRSRRLAEPKMLQRAARAGALLGIEGQQAVQEV